MELAVESFAAKREDIEQVFAHGMTLQVGCDGSGEPFGPMAAGSGIITQNK